MYQYKYVIYSIQVYTTKENPIKQMNLKHYTCLFIEENYPKLSVMPNVCETLELSAHLKGKLIKCFN